MHAVLGGVLLFNGNLVRNKVVVYAGVAVCGGDCGSGAAAVTFSLALPRSLSWPPRLSRPPSSPTPHPITTLRTNPFSPQLRKERCEELAAVLSEEGGKGSGCWVLADEIYERITYDTQHVAFATLPGMFERTMTVKRAGTLAVGAVFACFFFFLFPFFFFFFFLLLLVVILCGGEK